MTKDQKPRLVMCGPDNGRAPTFEDICARFRALTGREETPETLAETRGEYDTWVATLPEHERPRSSTSPRSGDHRRWREWLPLRDVRQYVFLDECGVTTDLSRRLRRPPQHHTHDSHSS
jgi:hypothetical protein